MFADDAMAYNVGATRDEVISQLQEGLATMEIWYSDNRLCTNAIKSKWMMMCSNRKAPTHSITPNISGQPLQNVSNYKQLGILLDSNLGWSEHKRYS